MYVNVIRDVSPVLCEHGNAKSRFRTSVQDGNILGNSFGISARLREGPLWSTECHTCTAQGGNKPLRSFPRALQSSSTCRLNCRGGSCCSMQESELWLVLWSLVKNQRLLRWVQAVEIHHRHLAPVPAWNGTMIHFAFSEGGVCACVCVCVCVWVGVGDGGGQGSSLPRSYVRHPPAAGQQC